MVRNDERNLLGKFAVEMYDKVNRSESFDKDGRKSYSLK